MKVGGAALGLAWVVGTAAAKKAEGDISWEEAKCIMKDRKLVFVGDSNTRYWSFVFAVFLDTGELRHDDYEKCPPPPRRFRARARARSDPTPFFSQGATRARTTTRTGRTTRGATGCGTASRRARATR